MYEAVQPANEHEYRLPASSNSSSDDVDASMRWGRVRSRDLPVRMMGSNLLEVGATDPGVAGGVSLGVLDKNLIGGLICGNAGRLTAGSAGSILIGLSIGYSAGHIAHTEDEPKDDVRIGKNCPPCVGIIIIIGNTDIPLKKGRGCNRGLGWKPGVGASLILFVVLVIAEIMLKPRLKTRE